MPPGDPLPPQGNRFPRVETGTSSPQGEEVLAGSTGLSSQTQFEDLLPLFFFGEAVNMHRAVCLPVKDVTSGLKGWRRRSITGRRTCHVCCSLRKRRFLSVFSNDHRRENVTNAFWRHNRKYSMTGECILESSV